MAIFNSYVSLPEGINYVSLQGRVALQVDEPSIIDESIWILPSKCKTTLKRTVEKKTPPVFPGIVSQAPQCMPRSPARHHLKFLLAIQQALMSILGRWQNHGRCGMSHLEMVGVFWDMAVGSVSKPCTPVVHIKIAGIYGCSSPKNGINRYWFIPTCHNVI